MRVVRLLGLLAIGLMAVSCQAGAPPQASEFAAASTDAPAAVVTATVTPTATAIPPPTATGIPSPTTTPTATASSTPTTTPSPTPSPTATATPTPLPTPDGAARRARVPILMYHYLSDPPPRADRYRRDLAVSPAQFEQQLAYLKAEGYQTISLYDLLYHLTLGWPLPDNPAIITFDDGYRDNHTNAFPLLRKYGFTATFFVLTEVTGQDIPEYMNWDQLVEMQATGMDIECHARVHEDLTEIDPARLVWQVLGCREMIENELGQRPRFVAYPSGIYDDQVSALFASDSYWGGITTRQGIWHSSDKIFEIERLRVRNTTTVEEFAELLAWEGE